MEGGIEWTGGVFSIITAMITVIGIIMATRVIFIDVQYSQIIKEFKLIKEKLEKSISEKDKADGVVSESLSVLLEIIESRSYYKNKRDNNKALGLFIDVFVLTGILIIGVLSTHGLFALIVINILVLFLFSFSITDFIRHIQILRKYKNKSV